MTQVTFGPISARSLPVTNRTATRELSSLRRHPYGSIDVDHYRTRATALRGEAKRDARLLRLACGGLVVLMMTFVGLLLVTAVRTYAPHREIVLIQTGEPRFD